MYIKAHPLIMLTNTVKSCVYIGRHTCISFRYRYNYIILFLVLFVHCEIDREHPNYIFNWKNSLSKPSFATKVQALEEVRKIQIVVTM